MTWLMIAFGALCGAGFVVLVASEWWGDHRYRQGYDDGRHEQANATPYPTQIDELTAKLARSEQYGAELFDVIRRHTGTLPPLDGGAA